MKSLIHRPAFLRVVVLSLFTSGLVLFGGAREVQVLEPIDEVFGVTLGQTLLPAVRQGTYTILDGEPAYMFTPDHTSRVFDRYLVQITPSSHLVHTIISIGTSGEPATCRQVRNSLIGGLTKKHGTPVNRGNTQGFDPNADYDIIVQDSLQRGIGLSCGSALPGTLQMIYIDRSLASLAKQEALDWKRKVKLRLENSV